MAKIRHIALTTSDPSAVAEFYKEAFEMTEIRRAENGAVFLTDGYINLAILNHKTEKDADVGPDGPNYNGIHHIGFKVDNLEGATEKLDALKGVALNRRDALDMVSEGPRNVEMKWAGPDQVVIDISESGWATS